MLRFFSVTWLTYILDGLIVTLDAYESNKTKNLYPFLVSFIAIAEKARELQIDVLNNTESINGIHPIQ